MLHAPVRQAASWPDEPDAQLLGQMVLRGGEGQMGVQWLAPLEAPIHLAMADYFQQLNWAGAVAGSMSARTRLTTRILSFFSSA